MMDKDRGNKGEVIGDVAGSVAREFGKDKGSTEGKTIYRFEDPQGGVAITDENYISRGQYGGLEAAGGVTKVDYNGRRVYERSSGSGVTIYTPGKWEEFLMQKEKEKQERWSRPITLRSRFTTVIISFLAGIFFLSTNITGNAIVNLSNTTSNSIGAVFILIAIGAGFFWIKSNNKKVEAKKILRKKR